MVISLCILIPLFCGCACFLAWRSVVIQRLLTVVGMLGLLTSSAVLTAQASSGFIEVVRFGNWPAPFGIVFVADRLAAIMVLVTALIGLAIAIYSLADISERRQQGGYFAFLHFLIAGVCGAFLTGDIFNLFVWFEVMLISSFALMTLGGGRNQMEGSVKYVVLNLISSSIFLAACGILYGTAGTLNLADLARLAQGEDAVGWTRIASLMLLVAFGLKAGVFPLFFWLPASYHTPPVAVSAVFAGLLTKVGVYALIRVFSLIFCHDVTFTHTLLLAVAVLTMVTGVFGAMVQYDFRRLLSFHIISQIGYIVLGLALFTPLALAGSVFYLFHHIIVKANLFLISGIVRRCGGSFDLLRLGGMLKFSPLLAVLFFIPAMSLGGIPPLSGFFAKLIIVKSALIGESPVGPISIIAGFTALGVGLLTLFSMTKIWAEVFWKAPKPPVHFRNLNRQEFLALCIPAIVLAALTVAIGLAPSPLLSFSFEAAHQLLNPSLYIEAVLGERS